MIKKGAWQLYEIIDKNKSNPTDFYSLKCKDIIVDKASNKKYYCSKNYVLFDNLDLFEDSHDVELIPIKGNLPCLEKFENGYDKQTEILNDIWINTLFK